MSERVSIPDDYYQGSSDYPKTGGLAKHIDKSHGWEARSRDWGPEKAAIVRELLTKWEAARKMQNSEQAYKLQDEINDELGQDLDSADLLELISDLKGEKSDLDEPVKKVVEEEMDEDRPDRDVRPARTSRKESVKFVRKGSFAKHNQKPGGRRGRN